MKQLAITICLVLVAFACKEKSKADKDQRILSSSAGPLNHVSVVIDNDLWKGNVGSAIRKHLAAPFVGLPQDEPRFNMNQIPPSVFSGFAAKSRLVLKVEKGKAAAVKIVNNVYAKPQKVVVVSGANNQELVKAIDDNAKKICDAFTNQEISEKQRRISKSLHNTDKIEKNLGLSIKFPSVYRIAKEEDKFFWIRKDITTGTVNFMLYELPLSVINENEELIPQVIKIRDSVGKVHIPGELEGSYMITEEAYSPYLFKTVVDNKPTIETRGTWEVKKAYMAGPFANFLIKDEANQRYIVAEGFTFAPSIDKRNYMFELDAIIKSITIK